MKRHAAVVPAFPVALPAAALVTALALLAGCAEGAGSPEPAGSAGSETSESASPTEPSDSATPSPSPSSSDTGDESASPVSTQGWRTEVWRDLQLQVPSGWALGYAPITEGDDVLECAVGPLGSDGPDGPDTATPYVGRPGYGSDACDGTGDVDLPEQDFVWFGSPLERGETEEGARTVTTVEIDSETVTVGAAPEVAAAIVESLTEVGEDDNGCPAQPKPETRYPVEGFGEAQGLSVCYYERGAGDQPGVLARHWTERLGARPADQLARAVALGRRADCEPAQRPDRDQRLLLRATFKDDFGSQPLVRDYLVEPGECPVALDLSEGVIGEPRPVALSERILDAWAGEGVETYVGGLSVPRDLAPYFKAPQG